MYRFALYDECKSFISLFFCCFSKWKKRYGINVELFTFDRVDGVLYEINEYGHFHIIFIGIGQGVPDSLKLASNISKQCPTTMIIFNSSRFCYARLAYRFFPFYFFSKPIKQVEFYSVMNKAIETIDAKNEFYFSYKGFYYSVPVKEIIYFFSEGRRVGVVSKNCINYFYEKLDEVEEKMKNRSYNFLRIHKSYLINRRHISIYQYNNIEMKGNENLPISRSKMKIVRDILYNEWNNGSNDDIL